MEDKIGGPDQSAPKTDQPLNSDQAPFRTPEEVAATQTLAEAADEGEEPPMPSKRGGGWRQKLALHWPPGKKEWSVFIIILLLIGGGVFYWTQHHKKPVIQPIKKVQPHKSKTVASQLTGLQVDPSVNQRPVTGVMIENSLDARPQSGLSEAGVVFEAIAEGGITRFLALYQDNAPGSIGPVRSARPYYVRWDQGFDAPYAHVGGSPEALALIKTNGVRDLDQFYNSSAYQRVGSRPAPHNVYTSMAALNQLEASKGYLNSVFTSLARQKPAPAKVPTAKTINIAISGALYNVHYDYKTKTNTYDRSEGGGPQLDANGNVQISPKVVVVMVMSYGIAADGHSQYGAVGNGPVFIFQDGKVATGQWSKPDDKAQISFTDAANKPLKLNPGQTWFTAVNSPASVNYAP